jgi:hypothetical protein
MQMYKDCIGNIKLLETGWNSKSLVIEMSGPKSSVGIFVGTCPESFGTAYSTTGAFSLDEYKLGQAGTLIRVATSDQRWRLHASSV